MTNVIPTIHHEAGPGPEITGSDPEVELMLAQDVLLARIDAAIARAELDENRTESAAIKPYQSSNPHDWKSRPGESRTIQSNLSPLGPVMPTGTRGITHDFFIEFFETETVGTHDIQVPDRNKEVRPKIQTKLINNKIVPKSFRGMKHRPVNHLSTPAPKNAKEPARNVEKMGVRMFMADPDDIGQKILVGEYSLDLLTANQRAAIESGETTDQAIDSATLADREANLARISWLLDLNDAAIEQGGAAPRPAPIGAVAVASTNIFGRAPAHPIRN